MYQHTSDVFVMCSGHSVLIASQWNHMVTRLYSVVNCIFTTSSNETGIVRECQQKGSVPPGQVLLCKSFDTRTDSQTQKDKHEKDEQGFEK